jgi:hypothetical protein
MEVDEKPNVTGVFRVTEGLCGEATKESCSL